MIINFHNNQIFHSGEELIEKFLILNKFRMETTKEKFDNYYSVRSVMPDIFVKNIDEAFLRNINDKM